MLQPRHLELVLLHYLVEGHFNFRTLARPVLDQPLFLHFGSTHTHRFACRLFGALIERRQLFLSGLHLGNRDLTLRYFLDLFPQVLIL